MLYNVPQYTDVEDKIAGPLTAKQFLWMLGMGAVLLVLWNIFAAGVFWILAIPVIIIFVAFAFYKPYGQPMILFVSNALLYLFRSKVYVWNRPIEPIQITDKAPKNPTQEPVIQAEAPTMDRIHELSKVLDEKKPDQPQRL